MVKWIIQLILALVILIPSAFAQSFPYSASWQQTFYTDDSPYYLRLTPDGFIQRFRVDSAFCYEIKTVQLVFPNSKQLSKIRVSSTMQPYNIWPKLYGIDEANSCWFQVEAKGLNLNNPTANKYLVKIEAQNSQAPFYYGGIKNSLISGNRLYQGGEIPWNELGAFGATPVMGGGVFYKLWEPIADEVHLFINNGTALKMIPDGTERTFNSSRSHVLYIPESQVGDQYYFQFLKGGAYEQSGAGGGELSAVKIDPMAKALVYKSKGSLLNNYKDPRAVVVSANPYNFQNDSYIYQLSDTERDNWIIYQIWPLAFNPKQVGGRWIPGTFRDISEKVDYISDLGVTAVEFMPINETRFYTSWGYLLDSILLIEKVLGQPDDLKYLVDQLHGKKIRVILDIVLNHINNTLIRDPLSKTVSQSKFYDGYNWGPKPRFSSMYVRKMLNDSLISLIRDYHIDGFRFDMTPHIYMGDEPGYRFLQELNVILKQEHPTFYSSAEELPDNVWVTFPVQNNGLGFDSQWSDLFKNFFEKGFHYYRPYNRKVNPNDLHAALYGFSNHQGAHFGPPSKTVNYIGSHDVIGNADPILRAVSDYKFTEWAGNVDFQRRVRPLEDPIDTLSRFRLIHNEFTHSVGKMAYGILFTKPGAILFYQGEEFGQDLNIENEWSYINPIENNSTPSIEIDVNRYVGSHRVPWEYLRPGEGMMSFLTPEEVNLFKGYRTFFKNLIKFRRDFPQVSGNHATNVQIANNQSILSYEITSGTDHFFVVVNFGYEEGGTWINFPGTPSTWWEEIFNSSSPTYGGTTLKFQNVISNIGGRMNQLRMSPSSISVFKKSNSGKINVPLCLRGTHNNWSCSAESQLKAASASGEIYYTTFDIENAKDYEFKMATPDWGIEMGRAMSRSTSFSYLPWQPNVQYYLTPGKYRFIFNLKTFEYSFTLLN